MIDIVRELASLSYVPFAMIAKMDQVCLSQCVVWSLQDTTAQ